VSDEQLLAALNSMESRLDAKISSVRTDLLEHIQGVGGQLHTQIQEVVTQVQEVVERLDRIEGRLDRQGGLLQGGSRAITRFIGWSENADISFSRYDRRLARLERRLEEVEKGKNGKSSN
jgi:hypothetical protein